MICPNTASLFFHFCRCNSKILTGIPAETIKSDWHVGTAVNLLYVKWESVVVGEMYSLQSLKLCVTARQKLQKVRFFSFALIPKQKMSLLWMKVINEASEFTAFLLFKLRLRRCCPCSIEKFWLVMHRAVVMQKWCVVAIRIRFPVEILSLNLSVL